MPESDTRSYRTPIVIALIACFLVFLVTSDNVLLAWTTVLSKATVQRVDLAEVSIDRPSGLRVVDGTVFSGVALSRYPDGQLASEERFLDGRRHGVLRRWFPSGALAFDSHYRRGRRHGVTTSWWSNGQMRSRTVYVEDQPDGVVWYWYSTGQKFQRAQYDRGKPIGLQKGWRRNGKLFSNFEYRNGRVYGLRNSNLCVELENEQWFAQTDI